MKIALVHDFLKEYGGAERVLEALHEIYPQAPVYTAFIDPAGLGSHWERIKNWDIRPSFLQKFWLIRKLHSPLRFLTPLVWESFNFDTYDVVISSSGWYICRGIITKPSTLHICYLHHPPRHLYSYKTAIEWQKYLPIKIYGNIVNHFLRIYDFAAAQRVDYFIANSKETERRIKKFYRREAVVIHPPASIDSGNPKDSRNRRERNRREKDYFLCVSRLARAKNIHLAIEACNRLDLDLWVVGSGREEKYLKSIAGPKIKFLGEMPDEKLPEIYTGSRALIFPAEDEEFGIVPVEAASFGIPVIALRSGGVVESVIEGKTGIFFDQPTVESLGQAIYRYNDTYQYSIKPEDCLKQAKKFAKEVFKKKIIEFLDSKGVKFP